MVDDEDDYNFGWSTACTLLIVGSFSVLML